MKRAISYSLTAVMLLCLFVSACTSSIPNAGLPDTENLPAGEEIPAAAQTPDIQQILKEAPSSGENTPAYAAIIKDIDADAINNALKVIINEDIWLHGQGSNYSHLINKEFTYEYYLRELNIGIDVEVAVLFHQPIHDTSYGIFFLVKDKFAFSPVIFLGRKNENIKNLRYILKDNGSKKKGEGRIYFDDVKKPEYGKDSLQKYYLVESIAKEYLAQISHPEEFIEELYIFNFNESQYMIRILTLEKWESYEWIEVKYNIRNHRYEGLEPIFDGEISLEYYISQFIKSAYKLDITDINNPRIIFESSDSESFILPSAD